MACVILRAMFCLQTIANRIIELREDGVLDKECTYDEFLEFRAERLKNGK